MPELYDQAGDLNGQRLYCLQRLYDAPDYVKDASSAAVCGDSDVPLTAFADPVRRQFPMHTKAATWVSYSFLLDAKDRMRPDDFDTAKSRLKQAARQWHGNEYDLNRFEAKHAELSTCVDGADEDYALVIKPETGNVVRRYPLRNAVEVKAAAQYLQRYRDQIPLDLRQVMAERILEKASAYNADIKHDRAFLEKQAGHGTCAASRAAELVRQRATVIRRRDPERATVLDKAAEAAERNASGAREPETLMKLAVALDGIDREYNLTEYGPTYERPDDVFFEVNEKTAAECVDTHCLTASGAIYDKCDLIDLDLDTLAEVFGEKFASDVSAGDLVVCPEKFAKAARDLDYPRATLLDNVLRQAGVRPVGREISAQNSWLTPDVLARLAK